MTRPLLAVRATVRTVTILMFLCGLATPAMAQVPTTIAHQGLLEDSDGNPLTGTYDLQFGLFTMETGGTAIWTETHAGVNVENGAYAVQLGSQTSFASASVDFAAPYWLEMTVTAGGGGTAETLAPRTELTAVPYALNVAGAPGVAAIVTSKSGTSGPGTILNPGGPPVDLMSLTVDVPQEGYMIVTIRLIIYPFNQPGWLDPYGMYVDDVLIGSQYRTYASLGNQWNNLSQTHIIPVTAGQQVISLKGTGRNTGLNVSFDRSMTALFVPNALGQTD